MLLWPQFSFSSFDCATEMPLMPRCFKLLVVGVGSMLAQDCRVLGSFLVTDITNHTMLEQESLTLVHTCQQPASLPTLQVPELHSKAPISQGRWVSTQLAGMVPPN